MVGRWTQRQAWSLRHAGRFSQSEAGPRTPAPSSLALGVAVSAQELRGRPLRTLASPRIIHAAGAPAGTVASAWGLLDHVDLLAPFHIPFSGDGAGCRSNPSGEGRLLRLRVDDRDCGGRRDAFFNGLIVTAELNDVDSQAWLADVLGRIASDPAQRLGELPPLN